MEALGASALAIGVFGALKDLLDAVYQYPGGAVADRIGSQRALLLANTLAMAGYAVYWCAPLLPHGWPLIFAGVFLVMAWESFSLPATFALIGQSLPQGKRAAGFSVQSTLKRLPVLAAPPLGGWLIVRYGSVDGIRAALAITFVLAAAALAVQKNLYRALPPFSTPEASAVGASDRLPGGGLFARYKSWPLSLRRLLMADILARLAEGTSEIFLVLYVMDVAGLSAVQFGSLLTVQTITAIVVYYPAGRLADRWGRFPLVLTTFFFFALFPIAVACSRGYAGALLAFVVGGLREIGEPARKALITDLGGGGRDYGLYYLLRGLAVAPAALVGGSLWQYGTWMPFALSGVLGLAGVLYYALWHPSTTE